MATMYLTKQSKRFHFRLLENVLQLGIYSSGSIPEPLLHSSLGVNSILYVNEISL